MSVLRYDHKIHRELSVSCHDIRIHSKTKVGRIYFEQGLLARVGFCL